MSNNDEDCFFPDGGNDDGLFLSFSRYRIWIYGKELAPADSSDAMLHGHLTGIHHWRARMGEMQ